MSNLTVGLAIISGLVLAAVLAYNTWEARRARPRKALRQDDVGQGKGVVSAESHLKQGAMVEASLVDAALGQQPLGIDRARIEPTADLPLGAAARFGADDMELQEPLTRMSSAKKEPILDGLIDLITPVSLAGVVSGDAVLAAMPASRRVGNKMLLLQVLPEGHEQWEFPQAGQRYTALQLGVQLANRNGPLTEIEFSEFVMKAERIAESLDGLPDFPDMMETIARAKELDQFASSMDAQLSFQLRSKVSPWSLGYLHQQAARHGFVPGMLPGRLVLPSNEPYHPPLLTLSFDPQAALAESPEQSAVNLFTLALDVPQCPRELSPFNQLQAVAHDLAQQMDGQLTDLQGYPISQEAMDRTAADLGLLYDALQTRDFAAGSVLARRLFS